MSASALILIDIQNDFCPQGALAVSDGDAVVPPINRLLDSPGRSGFGKVVATADWHPLGHVSFASAHEGKTVYDRIEVEGIVQNLWPDHCVAGTPGADFHPDLDIDRVDLILRKGTSLHLDSYSAFFENDGKTPTGLHGYLQTCGIDTVFLAGLALDWCVFFSALDALALGYKTTVLQDLCRPVDQPAGFSNKRIGELRTKGVLVSSSESLI